MFGFNKKNYIRSLSLLLVMCIAFAVTPIQASMADDGSITETDEKVIERIFNESDFDSIHKLKESLSEEEKKLSTDLLRLVDERFMPDGISLDELKREMRENNQYLPTNDSKYRSADERVYVYVYLNEFSDIDGISAYLHEITDYDEKNCFVVAWAEVNKLLDLASNENVKAIHSVIPPLVNAGIAEAESADVLKTIDVFENFLQDGNFSRIGVISDGVDFKNDAISTGDLPPDLHVLSNSVGGDEGTAMLEIIHDMAPGAQLVFHDCGNNTAAFNSAIDALVEAGCNIIVDDVSWIAQPFFEDGEIAEHISEVLNENEKLIYITAAGNYAGRHYQGQYQKVSGSNSYHNKPLYVNMPAGGSVDIVLQWNDRFGYSGNDYDLFLKDYDSGNTLDSSEYSQPGNGYPIEYISYANNTGHEIDGVIIVDNHKMKAKTKTLEIYVYPSDGSSVYADNITPEDSIFGHKAVPEVIAVGAVAPPSATDIRYYSSRGPVTISYPTSKTRSKPDLCGIDGVSVSGAGGFSETFYGTSASCTTVAAVAALIWAQFPHLSGNQIRELLINNAKDLGSSGRDNTFGYGLTDAMKIFMATMADYTFSESITKKGGTPVEINITGKEAIEVWFAPNNTTSFVEGQEMTRATGKSDTIYAPERLGTYKLYLVVDGEVSSPSKATLTVDNSPPSNQDYVFSSSAAKKGGAPVAINSSGDPYNSIWFAPAGTVEFIEGETMTKAIGGKSTTISAPAAEGSYKLYIVDFVGDVSNPSTATLTVDNTPPDNQDTVFPDSTIQKGGGPVTITGSGDATNSVWFAPDGTAEFSVSATMTKAANGTAATISAPGNEGTYKLYVIDEAGNISAPSTAELTVDNTPPTNQDSVFASSITKKGGVPVAIESSGDATNSVWFAPSGTVNFIESTRITKAAGDATTIMTPATTGIYKLFVLDAVGNASAPSAATLTVDATPPNNQNTVFSKSVTKKGGEDVTIKSSGDVTNEVWFAPSATTVFTEGANMTKAENGLATSIAAPADDGMYKLFLIDAVGNVSDSSSATLTVDNTPPVFEADYPKAGSAGGTVANVLIKLNEPATAYYAVLPADAAAPGIEQVIAGTDAEDNALPSGLKGAKSINSDAEEVIRITGLSPLSSYTAYIIAEDSMKNLQNSLSQIEITTGEIGTVAALSDIKLSTGELKPAFNSNITEYTVSVNKSVSSILITPIPVHVGASIIINKKEASAPISLSVGKNTIAVKAVSEDGNNEKTYSITVTRVGNGGNGGRGGGGGGGGPVMAPPPVINLDPVTSTQSGSRFTDIGNYPWAMEAINSLADHGVIKGTSENTFSPGTNITRADFAILLVRALNLTSDSVENFSDVPADAYYSKELAVAKGCGIVTGIGNNRFNPTAKISRQDIFVIAARALEKSGYLLREASSDVLSQFSDANDISDYAKQSAALLIENGIIAGSNGKINPKSYATRAEIAVLIKRILDI